jgi:hypothetical protein
MTRRATDLSRARVVCYPSPDWKRPSKNAVHDASECPGVAVTFGSERVVVCLKWPSRWTAMAAQ